MSPHIIGPIKSFGFMLALSFLAGIALSLRRGRARGLRDDDVLDLIFAVLVSSIIGVRLFYVLTHLNQFDSVWQALQIWDGGLTLYGGIVLAIAAVWWQARRRGIPFLRIADVFAPGVILGIGLTRVGCFLAGCCFGRPTACPLGVHFPPEAPATRVIGPMAVHPAQLYGSLGGFLIFGLLLWWDRGDTPEGTTFARFLFLYGVSRFLVDFTRYYEPGQVVYGLSNNQWISVGLIVVGMGLHLVLRAREA